MNAAQLVETAHALVAPGKGILAADESTGTIRKRLEGIGVESTPENRRTYRHLLFTTQGIDAYLSGVILYDETIQQQSLDGAPFPQLLADRGIIPGIKVDEGTVPLAGFPGEQVTEGLDGLRDRLVAYREMGAQFAKWRAVILIGDGIPSKTCLQANAEALARYAALCQEQGLVPIVEPEVLMDGTHGIEQAQAVTAATLQSVFAALYRHRVLLEGMLLKPNMVLPGREAAEEPEIEEVAERTISCFRRNVPAAVPGIVFLSGGQRPEEATAHLNAMNNLGPHPWELSFSYGRALQEPFLESWHGNGDNVREAQHRFQQRARLNSAARDGRYSTEMEAAAA